MAGGDASERSSRKLKSSLLPKRRGSASLQQSQHAVGGRKQRGVGVGGAEQLKPERKAAVLKVGKRDRENAEHRARNHKRRIPCPVEADRGRARRRQRQAGVEFLRQRLIDGAPSLTLGDVAAIVVEGHRLSPCGEVVHRLAELARVARSGGVERPARLPGDDVMGELPSVVDRVLARGDVFIFTARYEG